MTAQPSTLFRGATVLTLDPAIGDLEPGDVLVEGGRIRAVAAHVDPPDGAGIVDARGAVLIPGMIDTHRHMWEALLRGSAPQHTLPQYMTDVLGHSAPVLTPGELHLGTLLSARAALAAGVTTVQDVSNIQVTPAYTDAIVAAHRESGLRTVFGYGKDYPTMQREGAALPEDTRRVRSELLPDDDGLVTLSLITERADDVVERHNAALARDLGVRVARHVFGPESVAHLREIGALLPGTTFIHGNGLDREELAEIAGSSGGLSVSPTVEMIMGHGFPMIVEARARPGLTISLSADVEVTVPADLFTQMRAAYESGRYAAAAHGAHGPTPRELLEAATIGGARTLGLDDRTGSLTPGKQADLVLLRADRPDVAPVYDPYSTVVLQADRAHVDTVLVAGRAAVRDGRATDDSRELVAAANRVARRLADAGVVPHAVPHAEPAPAPVG